MRPIHFLFILILFVFTRITSSSAIFLNSSNKCNIVATGCNDTINIIVVIEGKILKTLKTDAIVLSLSLSYDCKNLAVGLTK